MEDRALRERRRGEYEIPGDARRHLLRSKYVRIRTAIITASAALLSTAASVILAAQAPQRPPVAAASTQAAQATYVGSKACQRCHAPTYERWSKTRMANVVRDPREHPDAVIPDFTK